MTRYADPPVEVVANLRRICLALPEAQEEHASSGTRWTVRRRTFAHAIDVDGGDRPFTVVSFRSPLPERDALLGSGHPFFKAGWGTDVVGMVIDGGVDWTEVAELVTESYRVLAPRRLAALVDQPPA